MAVSTAARLTARLATLARRAAGAHAAGARGARTSRAPRRVPGLGSRRSVSIVVPWFSSFLITSPCERPERPQRGRLRHAVRGLGPDQTRCRTARRSTASSWPSDRTWRSSTSAPRGEASIAIGELKNEDGVIEAKVGDRIQATVVSNNRRPHIVAPGCSVGRRRGRQLEDAFRAGVARGRQSRKPGEGRLQRHASPSSAPSVLARRSIPFGRSIRPWHVGRVVHGSRHRVSGRWTEVRRVETRAARRRAKGARRRCPPHPDRGRSHDRTRRLGSRLRRVRRSGRRSARPAPRLRNGLVARDRSIDRSSSPVKRSRSRCFGSTRRAATTKSRWD